jgi:hypothetical protein
VEGSSHDLVKVSSRHFPGGTKITNEKPQSLYPVSGPRFEPGKSRILSRSVNHSTMMFVNTICR